MTVESQMILIFGATGDLNRRKLIPALYHLLKKKRLTPCTPIVCIGRQDLTKSAFLDLLSLPEFIEEKDPSVIDDLLHRIQYLHFDLENQGGDDFAEHIHTIQKRHGCTSNLLIYLALPTSTFHHTVDLIGALDRRRGWWRVVFEKPFGENLSSARALNETIRSVLEEDEIYRVDHYLGKELVQNILTLRFANEIFSGAWRGAAIDHIQITVSETLGVEKRAGYYDRSGAVRDMVQNHLLQLLSFVAMEPPKENTPDGLRNEAVAVIRNLRRLTASDIVLGQYRDGMIDGKPVQGYLSETGVAKDSTTETFVAIRAHVDTSRWQGVPFYLRTGKRLAKRYADIKIVFKQLQRHLVGKDGQPNMIIIRIQPNEGIAMAFNVQKPGENDCTESVLMDFCHHCHFGPNTPEAYESILHSVMEGDHSLFPRSDWIEASWSYTDVLRAVAGPVGGYSAGSSGPPEADALVAADGRHWFDADPAGQAFTLPDLRSKDATGH